MFQFDEDLSKDRLRLSLVLNWPLAPAWVSNVIRTLRADQFVDLQTVTTLPTVDARSDCSSSFLYQRYLAWDEWRSKSETDPLGLVDISGELAETPVVGFDEIRADAVIWLATGNPRDVPLERSRFGTLHFVPADPSRYSGEPPYFWELFKRDSVSGSAWLISNGTQESRIVAAGFASTEIGWSLSQNRTTPYSTAAALLQRALYNLKNRSTPGPEEASDPVPEQRCRKTPTNRDVLNFLGKNLYRSIHRRIAYSRKVPHWFVAWRTQRNLFVSQNSEFRGGGFRPIRPPKGHFFADPFVIKRNGTTFLFVEDYVYREGKGVISAIEVKPGGELGTAHRVLERPYHLSYPFVFEDGGSVYMIPETLESHAVELYRAIDFPWTWELVHLLRENVDAVDTTLLVENGIYYFFTNIAEPGVTPNDLLYLYYSDSLLGEWRSHPANPICTDVRSSRGAGCLFKRDGKLIRPAQDCSVRYGYACQLNEIEILSPTEFRERPSTRIEPNWFPGLIGTHTINSNDAIEVIDGQIYKAKHE